MPAITGKAINITVDGGTQLDLIEEDSFTYDAGESTNDFAYAAKDVTETFHETASPTIEYSSTIDSETAGLEAVGVIEDGADDGSQVSASGTRRITDATMEYLDAESGEVELSLDIPAATVEWSGFDGQNPPTMDFTWHLNEQPTIDNQTTTT